MTFKNKIIAGGAITAGVIAFTGITAVSYIVFESAIKQMLETIKHEFKIAAISFGVGAVVAAIITGTVAFAIADQDFAR